MMSHAMPSNRSHNASLPAADPEFAALIEQFADDLRARASEIQAELEAENFDGIRRVAHRIKGAAASYGFPQVGQTAQVVEQALRAGPELCRAREEIRDMVRRLIEQCRAADSKTDFKL